jgi:NADPH-dependent 2,4-dienoyl-CoA reductase/sulfur reductase-like enzyme
MTRRVLIVGGVAGGASCAARLRRLDESAEIAVFDRGPFVSFANCGLPYYVGDVIKEERALQVATPALFRGRFRIDVHTDHEVIAIDRGARTIAVRDLKSGATRTERYDALVLSPGAAPIRPPLSGVDLPGVFAIRSIPDSRRIREWISSRDAKTAVVVGGGFIGLEMVENLVHRGLAVTILEKLPQLMPPIDPEMAAPIASHVKKNGVALHLGDGLAYIDAADGGGLVVISEHGARLSADLVMLAIGVRPEVALARDAGLDIGARGGIVVDRGMRTSDPNIWAVGDAIEVPDVLTGQETVLPLAGPANREGRTAAESIAGRATAFRCCRTPRLCDVEGVRASLARAALCRCARQARRATPVACRGASAGARHRSPQRARVQPIGTKSSRRVANSARRIRAAYRLDAARQRDHLVLHVTKRGLERQSGARASGPWVRSRARTRGWISCVGAGGASHRARRLRSPETSGTRVARLG